VSPRGFPRGTAHRRIATYGEALTFENVDVSVDETSAWNDETRTVEMVTATGLVDRGRSATPERGERRDSVDADATVRVPDDELGGFEVRDYGDDKTTVTTDGGRKFVVVRDHLNGANVHEILVNRV